MPFCEGFRADKVPCVRWSQKGVDFSKITSSVSVTVLGLELFPHGLARQVNLQAVLGEGVTQCLAMAGCGARRRRDAVFGAGEARRSAMV
jgi:hypothetical protein